MKSFYCDHCHAPVYFENIRCLNCQSVLGIVPSSYEVRALEEVEVKGVLTSKLTGQGYRFCQNSLDHEICNQLVPEHEASPYCLSCRYTELAPDLSLPENKSLWFEMEKAKRRLLFSLYQLGITPPLKSQDSETGLSFRFVSELVDGAMTGHENGIVTITLAEADDATRAARRAELGEDYRTLLGHFRHEVGHYYWDRLVAGTRFLKPFRALFGDETRDYGEALQEYYAKPNDEAWRKGFISRYATAHPWEDWAESFAHFLHMRDVLETASHAALLNSEAPNLQEFEEMISLWSATSFRINEIGRSIGSGDLYPFVLNEKVIAKMALIHEVIGESAAEFQDE